MKAQKPLPSAEIATRADVEPETCDRYLSALKKAGYIDHENRTWLLKKNRRTGLVAPAINAQGDARDFNENPAPTPRELETVIKESGLSINAFAVESGLGPGLSTRLRQMMAGKRPIGPTVEKVIREWQQS